MLNVVIIIIIIVINLDSLKSLKLQNSNVKYHQINRNFLSSIERSENFSLPPKLNSISQLKALKYIGFAKKYKHILKLSESKKIVLDTSKYMHLNSILKTSNELEKMILRSNLRLVYAIALQFQNMGLNMNDLMSEGFKGLQKALSKYDVDRGFAFSTYAYPWIKDYVRTALSKSLPISLPRHVYKLLIKVQSIQSRFYAVYDRIPTDDELCVEMGLSTERFEIVRRALALAKINSDDNESHHRNAMIRFDESTWEEINSLYTEVDNVSLIESTKQAEPIDVALQSNMRNVMLSVLYTLPIGEAAAIYQRLGLTDVTTLNTTNNNNNTNNTTNKKVVVEVNKALKETNKKDKLLTLLFQGQILKVSTEEAATLYHKGMRRLRRRMSTLSQNKYPEVSLLKETIILS